MVSVSEKPLLEYLSSRSELFAAVVETLSSKRIMWLDLSVNNAELAKIDISETLKLEKYIWSELEKSGAEIAVGGYDEHRGWYARSGLFHGREEVRCLHLGVDVWDVAGTAVCAPLDGVVHSLQDNANFGDYGPTIILQHTVPESFGGGAFYTLYGHLSRESLPPLSEGMPIVKGQKFAAIGNNVVNGEWPPHLHFQITREMRGMKGDYPGTSTLSAREEWLSICPNPNLIMRLEQLAA